MFASIRTSPFSRRAAGEAARLAADFWRKVRAAAPHIPFAQDAVSMFYCAFDRETPVRVRAAILGALAYFILPGDAVPDLAPLLGYADDAAVLAATLELVASHIRPELREAAHRALDELSGG